MQLAAVEARDGKLGVANREVAIIDRQPRLASESAKKTFEIALERVRRTYEFNIYAYVVMPEHVHLLVSEPQQETLATVLKALKQMVSRRLLTEGDHFWLKRYYDLNTRNYRQFAEKLRYIHRNPGPPARAALARAGGRSQEDCALGRIGSGAASATTPPDTKGECRSSPNGQRESGKAQGNNCLRE